MLFDDYEYPYEGWERWERSKSLNSIKSTFTTNSVTTGNNNTTINQYGSTGSDGLAAIHVDSSSPILKRFQRSHSVNAGNLRANAASPTANGGEYRMNRKGISLKKLKKWYSGGTQGSGSDTKGAGWSPRLTKRRLKKSQSMPDTTVHLVL